MVSGAFHLFPSGKIMVSGSGYAAKPFIISEDELPVKPVHIRSQNIKRRKNMPINKSTEFGTVAISLDAIASLAGGTVTESYGIVGMSSQKLVKDGWAELLKRENYSKGVIVRQEGNSIVLDIYVIALQGIKLSEVMLGAQQRVKYTLEKTLEIKVDAVNIYVQGVQAVK